MITIFGGVHAAKTFLKVGWRSFFQNTGSQGPGAEAQWGSTVELFFHVVNILRLNGTLTV